MRRHALEIFFCFHSFFPVSCCRKHSKWLVVFFRFPCQLLICLLRQVLTPFRCDWIACCFAQGPILELSSNWSRRHYFRSTAAQLPLSASKLPRPEARHKLPSTCSFKLMLYSSKHVIFHHWTINSSVCISHYLQGRHRKTAFTLERLVAFYPPPPDVDSPGKHALAAMQPNLVQSTLSTQVCIPPNRSRTTKGNRHVPSVHIRLPIAAFAGGSNAYPDPQIRPRKITPSTSQAVRSWPNHLSYLMCQQRVQRTDPHTPRTRFILPLRPQSLFASSLARLFNCPEVYHHLRFRMCST